ncbi:MAG: hypothetical protein KDD60_12600 [Bdellovibrionales bacterium]|nr:hypothetical protein [Bdellovibrionales bacterium]
MIEICEIDSDAVQEVQLELLEVALDQEEELPGPALELLEGEGMLEEDEEL